MSKVIKVDEHDIKFKVNVAEVAATFKQRIKAEVSQLNFKPKLVGFLANGDSAAKKYAQWTKRGCDQSGIEFELRECTMLELESKLKEANLDDKVHGIMIYYPCFGSTPSFYGDSMDDYLRDSVAIEKDVEGLCYTYRRALYTNKRVLKTIDGKDTNKKCLLPCTPLAIVKALESLDLYDEKLPSGDRLNGKKVTVINRSEVVGRPVAAMLANDGADVYSVDIDNMFLMQRGQMFPCDLSIEDAVKSSNVLILGVPSKDYKLPVEWIQPNTIVLNVSSHKNVDEQALSKIPGVKYISQIGKVTVTMLERNLLRLCTNYHTNKSVKVLEGGWVVNV